MEYRFLSFNASRTRLEPCPIKAAERRSLHAEIRDGGSETRSHHYTQLVGKVRAEDAYILYESGDFGSPSAAVIKSGSDLPQVFDFLNYLTFILRVLVVVNSFRLESTFSSFGMDGRLEKSLHGKAHVSQDFSQPGLRLQEQIFKYKSPSGAKLLEPKIQDVKPS